MTREYSYTVLFEPADEGGYAVTVPALNGLTTEGDTLEEARTMAKEAIMGYLECLQKDGVPIPTEEGMAPVPTPPEQPNPVFERH